IAAQSPTCNAARPAGHAKNRAMAQRAANHSPPAPCSRPAARVASAGNAKLSAAPAHDLVNGMARDQRENGHDTQEAPDPDHYWRPGGARAHRLCFLLAVSAD